MDGVLHLPLAPWWKRLVAIMLDGAVVITFYLTVVLVIGVVTSRTSTPSAPAAPTPVWGIVVGVTFGVLIALLPVVLYDGFMNGSRRGQTLGKMALGIAVRDARTGGPIGFWRSSGRYLIATVFEVLLVVPAVIDNLAPLWDDRKQAWHDKAVHSVVVDLKP
jgi:uncharacterized RDD family membrane protein YckC